uniref:Uncharacterized protein n=1 Tax=Astyanax mexicanus TaxID=7994 RepID=A0A8B9JSE1_ASTMX
MLATYIKGNTPFPEYSFTMVLDDITVGYYSSETKTFVSMTSYLHADHEDRYLFVKNELSFTEFIHVQQRLVVCELMDNDKHGPMITKNAIGGSTIDELYYHEGKYTYQNGFNLTAEKLKPHLDLSLWRYGNMYHPAFVKALRGYLNKRSYQVKKKVKPRVRLIQRRCSVSGWDGVTCLATGFYPRGDLLLNGDGTYQMRKSFEFSEEKLKKHNYTFFNDVSDLDPGEPIVPIFGSVLAALFSVCLMAAVLWMTYRIKLRGRKSNTSNYSLYIYF